jgi:iron complex outermembrane recepter protein
MTAKTRNPIALFVSWLVLSSAPSHSVQAADSSLAGTIEGRVSNPANGEYLERARVTVEGTSLGTFTDSAGFYRVTSVPPGKATVNVFYTGFGVQREEVRVDAGETAHHDIAMGANNDVVRLSKFMVSTSREMTAAAIAINEQRFAPNIKGVVAADEFGDVAGGNVGEFLKFLPGVTIDFAIGARARGVSINGVPSAYVPVTVNGFNLAKGPEAETHRGMSLDMLSIAAISRVEVIYSPTPESQGSALGGSVNLIPPSAFERSRPEFRTEFFIMMRDNARDFDESPGPLEKRTRKVTPGFEFSYIRPVNKRFGFTLSGGYSKDGSNDDQILNTWRGVTAATNGTAFPNTTPDRPYLTSTQVQVGTKLTSRHSFGATADYKLSPNDQFSFSYQLYDTNLLSMNRTISYNITAVAPDDFTPTSTRGAAGQGNLQLVKNSFRRLNRIHTPSLVWRHNGPVWKAEAGVGFSRGTGTFRDTDHGYFRSSTARRTGVTISFDDIFYLRPNTISVTDATGQMPVDPYNINNYVVTAATARPVTGLDRQKGANASVAREFFGRLPFSIKGGVDFRENERELRAATIPYAFVGADGRASTAPAGSDDPAAPFFATSYSQRELGFGFPRVQWIDNGKLWKYYQANPTHIILDANAAYLSEVNSSLHAVELVSSGYLRSDLQLLDRRLHLTGGMRAEQTNVKAQGQLSDRTRNYRRDAGGNVILVNGAPSLIVPPSDALGVSQLTIIDRGRQAEKEYLRWFPSVNASFNLRDNLIARAAYYESIGRPDYIQYAGALTLPDITLPPSSSNRTAVNNAAIKPWSAQTASVRLEYYFEGVGQMSVGAFRRDFENFFGNTSFRPTEEFLGLNGLDPNLYGGYEVVTQHNIAEKVRMTGVDVSYKQALTILPAWARGVTVFANGAAQRAEGEASANFAGYIPRKASWGISLTRERFNVRMNWTYQSRNRLGAVAPGPSIGPGTFNWQAKRGFLDLLGEYYFTRRFGVYVTLRSVGDTPDDFHAEGPATPAPAQFVSRLNSGSLWTFGVKGTF